MSFGINIDPREVWLWWPRAWRQMMPKPRFHPPSPEISRPDEGEWQWWHIPVSVAHRWPRRDIPRCAAFAIFTEGEMNNKAYRLRWRSDLPEGSSEETLIFDTPLLLPLVARRDKSPKATLTDNGFLVHPSNRVSLFGLTGENAMLARTGDPTRHNGTNLDPGLHRVKIRIESGHLDWESDTYQISVPKAGATNSHFSVTASQ